MKKFKLVLMTMALFFTMTAGATAATTSATLSNNQAIKIAVDANTRYWNTLHGYKQKACTQKAFTYKGTYYSYVCSEFDTKQKVTSYLSGVYTNSAINAGLTKYGFITHNGKLARPVGDGGNMLEWNKAKVKLTYQRSDVRSYEFTVPDVEGGTVKRTVTFYKSGATWKVNKFDAVQ
ncbi:IseA DL-endopeptidase inhibitor family protein [Priestia flexa]|uniref:IseA DL-endopeptidase inhibitor family protein n=1 Tax=Priestia flexa TaxID=86664 RepID=UPI001CFC5B74|nr:IseA DL-endopeptidase inhibitor family protein [Priestia flexa]UIR31712.1 IseA DL-endopeptidase inhibitor family protein [Priestia flexa]